MPSSSRPTTRAARDDAPTSRRRRGTRAARRTRRWTLGVGVGAVLAGISLVDGNAVVALLQAAGGVLGIVLVFVALVGLRSRRPWHALVALVSAAVFITPLVHFAPYAPPAKRSLSVLAVNTYVGEADATSVVREVEARHADVLVLPEMTDSMWKLLQAAGLTSQLPHVTGITGEGTGMIVATREPSTCVEAPAKVRCGHVVSAPEDKDATQFAQITVRLQDGTLVRGVHLWTPRMTPVDRWHEGQTRMRQWVEAHRHDRYILAGDFNAGPAQPAFRAYADSLDRNPRELPWTRTWPSLGLYGALTQIDHVLGHGWRATDSASVLIPDSDHRGVWARFTR